MPKRPPRKDYVIIPVSLRVHADTAWTGRGVTMAFIDSGFYPHPTLTKPKNRIKAMIDVTSERLTASDFEAVYAASWHGTMVACMACANGYFSKGYYHGLASDADVVLIKAFDGKKIGAGNILRALRWVEKNAAALGIRIVNVSLGGDGKGRASASICTAIRRLTARGIVVVAAAGNNPARKPVPPAACEDTITVGGIDDGNSTDSRHLREYGTSHGVGTGGAPKPDIIAPSNLLPAPMLPDNAVIHESEILHRLYKLPLKRLAADIKKHRSRVHLPADVLKRSPKDMRLAIKERMTAEKFFAPYYQHVDGTSFAAPIVSSIIAQMLEIFPGLSPRTVKYILQKTARRLPDIDEVKQGAGLVTALRAVEWAAMERDMDPQVSPGVGDKRITFHLSAPDAKQVTVVGDFTAWQIQVMPMTRLDGGLWRVDIPRLSPGRYAYKFLIDGETWSNDPRNPMTEPDHVAGVNNVVIVGAPSD